ncbi:P-loop containing nucleoside triphosphate hydrolase protein [Hymenopellis radicata]|nr:P-loop containing nucleoside triphosphate hydrolase protein [Hymenopellis radicata]
MGTAPGEALLAPLRTAVVVCLTTGAASSVASRIIEEQGIIMDSTFQLHFFPKFAEALPLTSRRPLVPLPSLDQMNSILMSMIFNLHSTNLKTHMLAFPFDHVADSKGPASFDEHSDVLAILFKFIYPEAPSSAKKVAYASHKYQITAAVAVCDIRMEISVQQDPAAARIVTFGGDGRIDRLAIHTLSQPPSITIAVQAGDVAELVRLRWTTLEGCTFGECVQQFVVDNNGNSATSSAAASGPHLGGGVIAGLAVIARKAGPRGIPHGGVGVEWSSITYVVPAPRRFWGRRKHGQGYTNDKTILDSVTGRIQPGQMMAILGPSGAGKTTRRHFSRRSLICGQLSGSVHFTGADRAPRIGFVSQQDVLLPPMLTVYEALLFAARLRLPESISETEKVFRVEHIMEKLGIAALRNSRIRDGNARGISGGEMRRLSIGLELIASPDVLILDEPTSGLHSVSASSRVGNLLHDIAHDPENPTAILVLAYRNAIYTGPGGFAPVEHLNHTVSGVVPAFPGQGYNVADYLLDVTSDPPFVLLQSKNESRIPDKLQSRSLDVSDSALEQGKTATSPVTRVQLGCATRFLIQLECLSGKEWKILKR